MITATASPPTITVPALDKLVAHLETAVEREINLALAEEFGHSTRESLHIMIRRDRRLRISEVGVSFFVSLATAAPNVDHAPSDEPENISADPTQEPAAPTPERVPLDPPAEPTSAPTHVPEQAPEQPTGEAPKDALLKPSELPLADVVDSLHFLADSTHGLRPLSELPAGRHGMAVAIKSLAYYGAVTVIGDIASMQRAGWHLLYEATAEAGRQALTKVQDELSAFRLHREKELAACREIEAAESDLEAAKAHVTACKSEVDAAHQALASVVREIPGQQILDLGALGETANGRPAGARPVPTVTEIPTDPPPATASDIPADRRSLAIRHGLTLAKLEEANAGAGALFDGKKKPLVATVQAYATHCIAKCRTTIDSHGTDGFRLLMLCTPEEWDQIHAEKYGQPCRDPAAESVDDTALKKTGGEYCGMVVRVRESGKKGAGKNMVVCPDDMALIVTIEEEAPAAPLDPKQLAAGEGLQDDSAGLAVHSDPND